jgi:hypothetical protein
MPEVIAHESQIDQLVRHVRPCAVTQPVCRGLFKAVRALRLIFTARTQEVCPLFRVHTRGGFIEGL